MVVPDKIVSQDEKFKKKSGLPSFWVPSLTPSAKATEIKKPVI